MINHLTGGPPAALNNNTSVLIRHKLIKHKLSHQTASGCELRTPNARAPAPPDSGSHKVQHYLNAISLKIEASLLTIDGPPENSSELERALGARSIADEFSGGPSIVSKLASILSEIVC